MSNAERVKKWRNANRTLWNMRRRQYRRGKEESMGVEREETAPATKIESRAKIEQLRELVRTEVAKVPEPKALIYRDDYGRVISEGQWRTLQGRKQSAKENGYAIDEYSQF